MKRVNEIKVGDKIICKAMDASMIDGDRINTVTKIREDGVEMAAENGISHFVPFRLLQVDKWYQRADGEA